MKTFPFLGNLHINKLQMDVTSIYALNLTLNCLKNVQDFDGTNVNHLPDFISQIVAIMPILAGYDDASGKILFGFVRNKCVGISRPFIHRYGKIENGDIFKEIFLKNVGEKDNSDTLMDMLKMCRVPVQ